jgi:O-antigen/teichoic acid export membrane protein
MNPRRRRSRGADWSAASELAESLIRVEQAVGPVAEAADPEPVPDGPAGGRRSYREGFTFAVISVGVLAVLGLVTTFVTARIYGVDVIGQFALAYAPTGAVWFLSTVREQPAMIRKLAELPPRSTRVTGIFVAVFAFSSSLTLVVSALAAVVTWFVFHGPVHHPALFWPAVAQLAGYLVITNTGMNFDSIFAAFRAGRQLFWIRLHQAAAYLVFVAVAGAVWGTVWAYTLSVVASSLSSVVHRSIRVRGWMRFSASREDIRAGFRTLPEILRFGLKITPGSVADGVSTQAGTWILGALSTTAAVGAYNRAWNVGTRLLNLTQYITEMTFPTLVERRASGDHAGFDIALVDSFRYVIATLLLPAAALGGASLGVMQLLGSGFSAAADAFALLLILPAILTASNIQGLALFALDRPWLSSVVSVIRMLVTIALSAVLIAAFGITGAAAAICAGALLDIAIKFAVTKRHMQTPLLTLWRAREQVAVVLAYAAGYAAARIVDQSVPGALGLVAAVPAGCVAYAGAFVAAGGVNRRDQMRLRSIVSRIRRSPAVAT